MKASSDSKGFILENFPRNQEEFEEFNSKVRDLKQMMKRYTQCPHEFKAKNHFVVSEEKLTCQNIFF